MIYTGHSTKRTFLKAREHLNLDFHGIVRWGCVVTCYNDLQFYCECVVRKSNGVSRVIYFRYH